MIKYIDLKTLKVIDHPQEKYHLNHGYHSFRGYHRKNQTMHDPQEVHSIVKYYNWNEEQHRYMSWMTFFPESAKIYIESVFLNDDKQEIIFIDNEQFESLIETAKAQLKFGILNVDDEDDEGYIL